MSEIKEIANIVELFCDTVKKYGKKKIMKSMAEIHSQKIEESNQAIIDYVIVQSCQCYGIDKAEIFKSRVPSEKMDAKYLAMSIIKKHTNLPNIKIAEVFKSKTRSEVSKALASLKNRNERYKPDADFLSFYSQVDEKTKRFLNFF